MQIKSERKRTRWRQCVPPGVRRPLTSFSKFRRDTTCRGVRLFARCCCLLLSLVHSPPRLRLLAFCCTNGPLVHRLIHPRTDVYTAITITTNHGARNLQTLGNINFWTGREWTALEINKGLKGPTVRSRDSRNSYILLTNFRTPRGLPRARVSTCLL